MPYAINRYRYNLSPADWVSQYNDLSVYTPALSLDDYRWLCTSMVIPESSTKRVIQWKGNRYAE